MQRLQQWDTVESHFNPGHFYAAFQVKRWRWLPSASVVSFTIRHCVACYTCYVLSLHAAYLYPQTYPLLSNVSTSVTNFCSLKDWYSDNVHLLHLLHSPPLVLFKVIAHVSSYIKSSRSCSKCTLTAVVNILYVPVFELSGVGGV